MRSFRALFILLILSVAVSAQAPTKAILTTLAQDIISMSQEYINMEKALPPLDPNDKNDKVVARKWASYRNRINTRFHYGGYEARCQEAMASLSTLPTRTDLKASALAIKNSCHAEALSIADFKAISDQLNTISNKL